MKEMADGTFQSSLEYGLNVYEIRLDFLFYEVFFSSSASKIDSLMKGLFSKILARSVRWLVRGDLVECISKNDNILFDTLFMLCITNARIDPVD